MAPKGWVAQQGFLDQRPITILFGYCPMILSLRPLFLLVTFFGVMSCSRPAPDIPVVMQWDHQPASAEWTAASLDMLAGEAAILTQIVPEDAEYWCPGYSDASQEDRALFYTGFLSALARYESTWNPRAVGGGGRWFGLMQIYPPTARYRSCEAQSGTELQNGAANVRCSLRIMAITIPRDGVISQGRRGVAADWGPMRDADKVAAMRSWLHQQPYCQG